MYLCMLLFDALHILKHAMDTVCVHVVLIFNLLAEMAGERMQQPSLQVCQPFFLLSRCMQRCWLFKLFLSYLLPNILSFVSFCINQMWRLVLVACLVIVIREAILRAAKGKCYWLFWMFLILLCKSFWIRLWVSMLIQSCIQILALLSCPALEVENSGKSALKKAVFISIITLMFVAVSYLILCQFDVYGTYILFSIESILVWMSAYSILWERQAEPQI